MQDKRGRVGWAITAEDRLKVREDPLMEVSNGTVPQPLLSLLTGENKIRFKIVVLRSFISLFSSVRHTRSHSQEMYTGVGCQYKTVSKGALCCVVASRQIPACIMNPLHQERASSSPT